MGVCDLSKCPRYDLIDVQAVIISMSRQILNIHTLVSILSLSTKKERFQRPSCKIVLWNQGFATMYIVSVYTRVGQHIFI